ncbi:MAG: zinc/manganese transport system substrate-binding protein [Pseudonocardiales bacterium]|nr:zinc/manganese transport system substrate-binding protein [Pseudonocardiales bacterium]
MPGRSLAAFIGAVGATAGCLCACSAASGETADISIVASTNVYGSVVQQLVSGLPPGRVSVTAILADASVDPHSYEASPRNELAISRADLIIENGGGYDGFVDTLRAAAGASAPVVNAVQLSGHSHDAELNEHVWYDLATVRRVAQRVTAFLLARDPRDAPVLRRNAAAFAAGVRRLDGAAARIRARHGGEGVAITEPVPLYLLQSCGLVNRTPPEFSQAIEEGTDASPRLLQATLDLFGAHQVRLLVDNEQTAGPQTDDVIAAARSAGVPVIGVTETLPGDVDYLSWMDGILHDIAAALS